MIVPAFLQPGELVHIIAPAGRLKESPLLQSGIRVWQDRGYSVTCAPPIEPWHYLAGSDAQRLEELYGGWQRDGVRVLQATRGGYGSMRLLEKLNWQRLDHRWPWLLGFSDITALLWSLAAQRGVMGVHAPVAITLGAEPLESQRALFHWLGGKLPRLTLGGEAWRAGKAVGQLLPGNLTVATHLLGTSMIPDWEAIVLALEDVAEPPYKIDRMLTQWRLSGMLERVKGIALGSFGWEEDPALVRQVLADRLTDLGIPIVAQLPFGHGAVNFPLPVGINCLLDGDRGELTWGEISV